MEDAAQRLTEKTNLHVSNQSCRHCCLVSGGDIAGGIRDFPNCKMGKRNQFAVSDCSDTRTSDISGGLLSAAEVIGGLVALGHHLVH